MTIILDMCQMNRIAEVRSIEWQRRTNTSASSLLHPKQIAAQHSLITCSPKTTRQAMERADSERCSHVCSHVRVCVCEYVCFSAILLSDIGPLPQSPEENIVRSRARER